MTALFLMYHRVCPRRPDTDCYFQRGTAVEPEVFAEQIDWLMARAPIVGPLEAVPDSEQAIVLSFDDGYRDLLSLDLPASVGIFPIANHLGESARAAFVDDFYAILQSAQCREPRVIDFGAPIGTVETPGIDDDPRWWVRGPFKEALLESHEGVQQNALNCLVDALKGFRANPSDLYLSTEELVALHKQGHVIGGHGSSHARLTTLHSTELERELRGSRLLLDQIGAAKSDRVFCYPDGKFNDRVVEAVADSGFVLALTVEPGLYEGTEPLCCPRYLVRNARPGTAGWRAIEIAMRSAHQLEAHDAG